MSDEKTQTAAREPDDLVAGLVADLKPVKPVRLVRAIGWALALEMLVAVLAGWAMGLPTKGFARLADPVFAGFILVLAAGAGASAAATAALAIPGRVVGGAWRAAVIFLPLLLAVVVVAFSPWGGTWKGVWAVLIEGTRCIEHTLEVAIPAWIAGLLLLRRLGPLDSLRVGLFAATSALLTSAIVVQLACPSCDSWHLALTHYLPVLLAGWAAALLSSLVLRRR